MPTHCFVLVLDRVPTEEELDRLHEAGCDDAAPGTEDGNGVMEFDREAPTLAAAITSAIHATETAGLHVVEVRDQTLLTLDDIADRTRISREVFDKYAVGTQGPGEFPAVTGPDGEARFYRWTEVLAWLHRNGLLTTAIETETIFVRANSVLNTKTSGHSGAS